MGKKALRVPVKRDHPRAALFLIPLLLLTLYAFARYGLPALPKRVQAPADARRVTREIEFSGLSAHLVTLAVADGPEAARVEAARYISRGAAGYLLGADGRSVIAGALYPSKPEAVAVAARLRAGENPSSDVLSCEASGARLRVSATGAQIQALKGGEALLRTQVEALGALAFALDSKATDLETARGKLYVASREANAAAQALRDAAGKAPDKVAGALTEILQSLATCEENLADFNAKSPLFFSSKMKYNQIDLRLRHMSFLKGLADP